MTADQEAIRTLIAERMKPFPATRLTQEDIDTWAEVEPVEDEIRPTIFGQEYNASIAAYKDPDLIYDPPKSGMFIGCLDEHFTPYALVGAGSVSVADLDFQFTSVEPIARKLIETNTSFQVVVGFGTERETRVQIKSSGKVYRWSRGRSGRLVWQESQYTIVPGDRRFDSSIYITAPSTKCLVRNVFKKDELVKGRVAKLSMNELWFVKDLFDVLLRLDEELLLLFGQYMGVCSVCNKPLTDLGSIQRGIGPACLKRVRRALRASTAGIGLVEV